MRHGQSYLVRNDDRSLSSGSSSTQDGSSGEPSSRGGSSSNGESSSTVVTSSSENDTGDEYSADSTYYSEGRSSRSEFAGSYPSESHPSESHGSESHRSLPKEEAPSYHSRSPPSGDSRSSHSSGGDSRSYYSGDSRSYYSGESPSYYSGDSRSHYSGDSRSHYSGDSRSYYSEGEDYSRSYHSGTPSSRSYLSQVEETSSRIGESSDSHDSQEPDASSRSQASAQHSEPRRTVDGLKELTGVSSVESTSRGGEVHHESTSTKSLPPQEEEKSQSSSQDSGNHSQSHRAQSSQSSVEEKGQSSSQDSDNHSQSHPAQSSQSSEDDEGQEDGGRQEDFQSQHTSASNMPLDTAGGKDDESHVSSYSGTSSVPLNAAVEDDNCQSKENSDEEEVSGIRTNTIVEGKSDSSTSQVDDFGPLGRSVPNEASMNKETWRDHASSHDSRSRQQGNADLSASWKSGVPEITSGTPPPTGEGTTSHTPSSRESRSNSSSFPVGKENADPWSTPVEGNVDPWSTSESSPENNATLIEEGTVARKTFSSDNSSADSGLSFSFGKENADPGSTPDFLSDNKSGTQSLAKNFPTDSSGDKDFAGAWATQKSAPKSQVTDGFTTNDSNDWFGAEEHADPDLAPSFSAESSSDTFKTSPGPTVDPFVATETNLATKRQDPSPTKDPLVNSMTSEKAKAEEKLFDMFDQSQGDTSSEERNIVGDSPSEKSGRSSFSSPKSSYQQPTTMKPFADEGGQSGSITHSFGASISSSKGSMESKSTSRHTDLISRRKDQHDPVVEGVENLDVPVVGGVNRRGSNASRVSTRHSRVSRDSSSVASGQEVRVSISDFLPPRPMSRRLSGASGISGLTGLFSKDSKLSSDPSITLSEVFQGSPNKKNRSSSETSKSPAKSQHGPTSKEIVFNPEQDRKSANPSGSRHSLQSHNLQERNISMDDIFGSGTGSIASSAHSNAVEVIDGEPARPGPNRKGSSSTASKTPSLSIRDVFGLSRGSMKSPTPSAASSRRSGSEVVKESKGAEIEMTAGGMQFPTQTDQKQARRRSSGWSSILSRGSKNSETRSSSGWSGVLSRGSKNSEETRSIAEKDILPPTNQKLSNDSSFQKPDEEHSSADGATKTTFPRGAETMSTSSKNSDTERISAKTSAPTADIFDLFKEGDEPEESFFGPAHDSGHLSASSTKSDGTKTQLDSSGGLGSDKPTDDPSASVSLRQSTSRETKTFCDEQSDVDPYSSVSRRSSQRSETEGVGGDDGRGDPFVLVSRRSSKTSEKDVLEEDPFLPAVYPKSTKGFGTDRASDNAFAPAPPESSQLSVNDGFGDDPFVSVSRRSSTMEGFGVDGGREDLVASVSRRSSKTSEKGDFNEDPFRPVSPDEKEVFGEDPFLPAVSSQSTEAKELGDFGNDSGSGVAFDPATTGPSTLSAQDEFGDDPFASVSHRSSLRSRSEGFGDDNGRSDPFASVSLRSSKTSKKGDFNEDPFRPVSPGEKDVFGGDPFLPTVSSQSTQAKELGDFGNESGSGVAFDPAATGPSTLSAQDEFGDDPFAVSRQSSQRSETEGFGGDTGRGDPSASVSLRSSKTSEKGDFGDDPFLPAISPRSTQGNGLDDFGNDSGNGDALSPNPTEPSAISAQDGFGDDPVSRRPSERGETEGIGGDAGTGGAPASVSLQSSKTSEKGDVGDDTFLPAVPPQSTQVNELDDFGNDSGSGTAQEREEGCPNNSENGSIAEASIGVDEVFSGSPVGSSASERKSIHDSRRDDRDTGSLSFSKMSMSRPSLQVAKEPGRGKGDSSTEGSGLDFSMPSVEFKGSKLFAKANRSSLYSISESGSSSHTPLPETYHPSGSLKAGRSLRSSTTSRASSHSRRSRSSRIGKPRSRHTASTRRGGHRNSVRSSMSSLDSRRSGSSHRSQSGSSRSSRSSKGSRTSSSGRRYSDSYCSESTRSVSRYSGSDPSRYTSSRSGSSRSYRSDSLRSYTSSRRTDSYSSSRTSSYSSQSGAQGAVVSSSSGERSGHGVTSRRDLSASAQFDLVVNRSAGNLNDSESLTKSDDEHSWSDNGADSEHVKSSSEFQLSPTHGKRPMTPSSRQSSSPEAEPRSPPGTSQKVAQLIVQEGPKSAMSPKVHSNIRQPSPVERMLPQSRSLRLLKNLDVGLSFEMETVHVSIRNEGFVRAVDLAYNKMLSVRPRLTYLLSAAEWRHVHVLMLYSRVFDCELAAAGLVQPDEFRIALPSNIQLIEPLASVLASIGTVEDRDLGVRFIPVAKPVEDGAYKPHDPEDVTAFLEWTQYDWNASWAQVELERAERRRAAKEEGLKLPESVFPVDHDKLMDWENLAVEKWLGWDQNLWFSYNQAVHILRKKVQFADFPRHTEGTYSWLLPIENQAAGAVCHFPKPTLGSEVCTIALMFQFSGLSSDRVRTWYYKTKVSSHTPDILHRFLDAAILLPPSKDG